MVACNGKKILHVTGMRSVKYGGLERYFVELARQCRIHDATLTIVYKFRPTSAGFLRDLSAYGAEVAIIPQNNLFAFSCRLYRLISRLEPDVIHTHFDPASYLSIGIARILNVKCRIRTLHSMMKKSQNETISFKTRFLRKIHYRLCTSVLCASEGIYDENKSLCRNLDKFRVLYIGTTPECPPRRSSTPTSDVLKIACVAFHDRIKGVDVLLDALRILDGERLPVRWKCYQVGGGKGSAELMSQVERLKLEDKIEFIGLTDDVPGFLSSMDIYCQPSRMEGLSLSIIEASMAGIPTVASDVGGIPEAVVDHVTGMLVPPESPEMLAAALKELLTDPVLREQYGKNAKNHAQTTFNLQNNMNTLMQVYGC